MSRSDYDDMPSGNGRRNGKGSRNMAVGLLIAILVILIIIVVKLIVSPEEKIEALPPVSSQSLEEETASESPVLADMEEEENTSPDSIEDFETDGGVADSEESTLNLVEEGVGDIFPSDSMEGETEEVPFVFSLESTPLESQENPGVALTEETTVGALEETPNIELSPKVEETPIEEISIEEEEMEPEVPEEGNMVIEEAPIVEEERKEPLLEEKVTVPPLEESEAEILRQGLETILSNLSFAFRSLEEEIVEPEMEESPREEEVVVEEEAPIVEIAPLEEVFQEELRVVDTPISEEPVEVSTIKESTLEKEEEILEAASVIEEEPQPEFFLEPSLILDYTSVSGEDGKILLSAKPGSAVRSNVEGKVIASNWVDGKKTISIETEEGEKWIFSGFERVDIKRGDNVKVGTVLGSVGAINSSMIEISLQDSNSNSLVLKAI
ncbi:MAG: peptidoglycan DD-metalloendopeptidase family protein [Candidatus Ornithospirochaeta sp.]